MNDNSRYLKYTTNKAEFEINGNVLKKKYFKIGNAKNDFELLSEIERKYNEVMYNGWRYRPLKVFCNSNKDSLQMEYFESETIREHYHKSLNPLLYLHMGRWLSNLHISTHDKKLNKVLSFNDYNDTNVLINVDKKEVVAVDPGNYSEIRENPGVSLVHGLHSMQRGILKKGINIINLLKGYYYFIYGYINNMGAIRFNNIRKGIHVLLLRKKILVKNQKKVPSIFIRSLRLLEVVFIFINILVFSFLIEKTKS